MANKLFQEFNIMKLGFVKTTLNIIDNKRNDYFNVPEHKLTPNMKNIIQVMLSLKNDLGNGKRWTVNMEDIRERVGIGRDAFRTARRKLIEYGYLKATKKVCTKLRDFLGTDYFISNTPKYYEENKTVDLSKGGFHLVFLDSTVPNVEYTFDGSNESCTDIVINDNITNNQSNNNQSNNNQYRISNKVTSKEIPNPLPKKVDLSDKPKVLNRNSIDELSNEQQEVLSLFKSTLPEFSKDRAIQHITNSDLSLEDIKKQLLCFNKRDLSNIRNKSGFLDSCIIRNIEFIESMTNNKSNNITQTINNSEIQIDINKKQELLFNKLSSLFDVKPELKELNNKLSDIGFLNKYKNYYVGKLENIKNALTLFGYFEFLDSELKFNINNLFKLYNYNYEI